MVIIGAEISHQRLWSSWLMANTIVERGRCFHAVVNDSVCESGSDLFLMRSTLGNGGIVLALKCGRMGQGLGFSSSSPNRSRLTQGR